MVHNHNDEISTEADYISKCISEFYNSTSDEIRANCQALLENFYHREQCWLISMNLIHSKYSVHVQFYAAKHLCEIINSSFEQISSNAATVEDLRSFFINKLTYEAGSFSHSVLNKLSTALAVLLLNSIPDIWPTPFKDLSAIWSNQPEILLRVFAEVAAEFSHLRISLEHRNSIKIELLEQSKEVMTLAYDALIDESSPPSLKNAAVESIELWLRLPGIKLSDFQDMFSVVFSSISTDSITLTRLLSTIKSNDELENLPQLVSQIAEFIISHVFPLIFNGLNQIYSEYNGRTIPTEEFSELIPLLSTIVEFTHDFMRHFVQRAIATTSSNNNSTLTSFCQFYILLSNMDNQFPTEESLSDLPEPFWKSLAEELSAEIAYNKMRNDLKNFFLLNLNKAIEKISYHPHIQENFDREQLEKFEAYRISRSEISTSSVQIAPVETLTCLANELDQSIKTHNVYRAEACIYLLNQITDFFTLDNFGPLLPLLEKCGHLENWLVKDGKELTRFADCFLDLIIGTEHLLFESANYNGVTVNLSKLILSYISLPHNDVKALKALVTLLKHKNDAIRTVSDEIISHCYEFFNDSTHSTSSRLLALRCVGMGISYNSTDSILQTLEQILSPRLISLTENLQKEGLRNVGNILFELAVLSQLLSILDAKSSSREQSGQSPATIIMKNCLPILDNLISLKPSKEIVEKICDLLKSSVHSLDKDIFIFGETYLAYLDTIIFEHSLPATDLIKSIFLIYQRESIDSHTLIQYVAKWFSEYDVKASTSTQDCYDENLLDLGHHIVKKSWPLISTLPGNTENTTSFILSLSRLICRIISGSKDTSLVKEGLRALSLTVRNCLDSHNAALFGCMQNVAECIISSVFQCIQSEIVTSCVNQISEILHTFYNKYPQETSALIKTLPGGDSQLALTMFTPTGNSLKDFKLRVLQMHKAALLKC